MFSLAFDLFVHNVLQLSNLFLQDLDRLRDFTPTEIIAKKLASKNPQILNFIKVFDPTDNNGTDSRV